MRKKFEVDVEILEKNESFLIVSQSLCSDLCLALSINDGCFAATQILHASTGSMLATSVVKGSSVYLRYWLLEVIRSAYSDALCPEFLHAEFPAHLQKDPDYMQGPIDSHGSTSIGVHRSSLVSARANCHSTGLDEICPHLSGT